MPEGVAFQVDIAFGTFKVVDIGHFAVVAAGVGHTRYEVSKFSLQG